VAKGPLVTTQGDLAMIWPAYREGLVGQGPGRAVADPKLKEGGTGYPQEIATSDFL
jgi:hypothetical protein